MSALDDFRAQHPQYSDIDDTTLAAKLHAKFYKDIPIGKFVKSLGIKGSDPTTGMSNTDLFLAGVGKAMTDVGRGVGQIIGVESRKDVDEARKLDQPLMKTTPGKIGAVTGDVVAATPSMMIPGANTAIGATILGGALGATQPVGEGESRLKNTALGAVGGRLGKAVGDVAGKGASILAEKAGASLAAKQAARSTIDTASKEAKASGYVLPPSQANPSVLNHVLEGISGKIKTAQKASEMNQTTTNGLVKKAIGLKEDAPITPESLNAVRKTAGQAYENVKRLGTPFKSTPEYLARLNKIGAEWNGAAKEFPDLVKNEKIETLVSSLKKDEITPEAAVTVVRKLRADASKNLKGFDDPEKTALGFAQRNAADAVEGLIQQNLKKTGQTELLNNFRHARQIIAKSHDVESALNETTGNVSARKLARLLDKGRPLTGELKMAARFAKAFPKAAQDVETIGSQPAFSALDYIAGLTGGLATHNPVGAAGILARPLARAAILSKPYQKLATTPSYSSSSQTLSDVLNSDIAKRGQTVGLSEALANGQ